TRVTQHTISLSVQLYKIVKLGVRRPCDLTENLSMYEPLEAAQEYTKKQPTEAEFEVCESVHRYPRQV
ncbi:hypothetical protein BDR04DRAFT_1092294, partial [Suillus decipiens]